MAITAATPMMMPRAVRRLRARLARRAATADGIDGDTILLGPPFIVTDAELEQIATVLGEAIEAAVPAAMTRSHA